MRLLLARTGKDSTARRHAHRDSRVSLSRPTGKSKNKEENDKKESMDD